MQPRICALPLGSQNRKHKCEAVLEVLQVRNGPDDTGTAQLAAATIIRLYQEENPKMLPMVKALLASQGLQT